MKIIALIIISLFPSIAFSQNKVIGEIVSTYNANQARFHTNHRGTQLNGVGIVQKVEADILGIGEEFMVTINSNGSNLICSTKNKNAASMLDKGERINFSGKIHDVLLGNLLVNNCTFSKYAGSIQQENFNNGMKENISKSLNIDVNDIEHVITLDVNGDGIDDFFIMISNTSYCGSGGCVYWAFVSLNTSQFSGHELGTLRALSLSKKKSKNLPTLNAHVHGNNCNLPGSSACTGELKWDGQKFLINNFKSP